MKKIADVAEKMGQVVTGGCRKLEDGVVSGFEKATYHFTATGVLLDEGHAGMGFSLESFCQNVHQTNSLFGANVAPLIGAYR